MEVKTYTFVAPCPVYDIEAMQTWLEDRKTTIPLPAWWFMFN